MTKDYKNFSKVANLAVERVKFKNPGKPKFCETETVNTYNKRRCVIHILRRGRVLRIVFERRRCSTSESMLVDEIKHKKYNKVKRRVGIM